MSGRGRPPKHRIPPQEYCYRIWGDYRSRGVRVGTWERTVRCESGLDALAIAERDERRESVRGGGVRVVARYILSSWRVSGDG